MRILHLIPSMLGGGAERQLCYLAEGQVRAGADVHVGYMLEGPNTNRLKASGARVHRLRWYRPYDPLIFHRIWSLMREIAPDVVQTWLRRMDLAGGAAARLLDLPWVYSERNTWVGGWRDELRALVANRASAIVANSETGAAHWR